MKVDMTRDKRWMLYKIMSRRIERKFDAGKRPHFELGELGWF